MKQRNPRVVVQQAVRELLKWNRRLHRMATPPRVCDRLPGYVLPEDDPDFWLEVMRTALKLEQESERLKDLARENYVKIKGE
jgi:hypothetical protein